MSLPEGTAHGLAARAMRRWPILPARRGREADDPLAAVGIG